MRRFISILLLVIGAWMLTSELLVAFLDFEAGSSDNLLMIGIFLPIAVVPLLLGTWISPGRRWRELGLTLLIACGIGVVLFLSMAIVAMDPVAMRVMPLPPEFSLAPAWGVANLLAIVALGWWLYRETKRN